MLSASDTAYPLLKANPTARELDELYTPNLFELTFAESQTRRPALCLGLLLLLKTFQRFGYFVPIADIPVCIVQQTSRVAGFPEIPAGLSAYDFGSARGQHMTLVRSYLGVKAFDHAAKRVMSKACVEASRVREDLADIINVGIEDLIRQRYELPGFTTLFRAARTARSTVNRGYYAQLARGLGLGRRTVRRYLRQERFPERQGRSDAGKSRLLDPWKPLILQRWNDGCRHSRRLFYELQRQGYRGSHPTLARYTQRLRKAQGGAALRRHGRTEPFTKSGQEP